MKLNKKNTKKLPEEQKILLDNSELDTLVGWVRFHILHQCARCKGELWEVGYYKDLYGQRYKCSDRKCNWGW